MKKAVKVWGFLAGLCLLAPAAFALEVVKEVRVDSVNGGQVKQEIRFWSQGYEDFVLNVQNGDEDGSSRISSAVVSLNGIKVLSPSDFSQKVATVQRAIVPHDQENVLTVNLRSNPGGFMVLQIMGEPTLNLPPDPGPAGDETIEGVDANANGVRDDIERWIGHNYRDSEKTRMALTQAYYPIQNMMIHARDGDRDAVYNDMDALGRASECLHYINPDAAHELIVKIESEILNTYDRSTAYLESSRILGGGTFMSKPYSRWKNSCIFNPDALDY